MKSIQEGKLLDVCRVEGDCDHFTERNKWNNAPIQIQLHITYICQTATVCPGNMDMTKVRAQIQQINTDFNGTNISFHFSEENVKRVVDAQYYQLPAYSNTHSNWYISLLALKNKYAYRPNEFLNIFVNGQVQGNAGTLLGIGTFPWDSDAPTNYGGLWVNALYFGAGQKTAAHEIGHNVGLWHTFHGDSEVSCTNDCYEVVHSDSGDDTFSNTVGDFCADTPAQPMNYNCAYPTGSDCRGNRYTLYGNNPALINNFMAYTPDNCYTSFTNQQSMRASCWICNRLDRYVAGQCPQF